MVDSNAPKSEAALEAGLSQFLQAFGLLFSQSAIYGLAHSVTKSSIDRSFAAIKALLAGRDSVNFAVAEETLMVDGIQYPNPTPAMMSFVERLMKLGVASFTLQKDIAQQEFSSLVELLHAEPEEMKAAGGFAQIIATLGLANIKAKKVILQQVAEDEVVVSRQKLGEALDAKDVNQVVSILKGDSQVDAAQAAAMLQAAATDSGKLADIVMTAAGASEGEITEEKVQGVVKTVRRFFEQVSGSSQVKTQKGKKELSKTLEKLEGELLHELQEKTGGNDPAAAAKIAETFEELKDELAIDSLAGEYARKRGAIEASEKRILRYLNAKGEEALKDAAIRDKLVESGLTPEEWDELLGKSKIGGQAAGGAGDDTADMEEEIDRENAIKAAYALADTLTRLGDIVKSAGKPAAGAPSSSTTQDIDAAVENIAGQVEDLAAKTEHKISVFVERVKKRRGAGGKDVMSKKFIVEFLAEIVQELRQPLSVILSTVGAIEQGLLGEVNKMQKEMLGLAEKSAERLNHLTDKLLEISGLPEGLTPNAKILQSVYQGMDPDSHPHGEMKKE